MPLTFVMGYNNWYIPFHFAGIVLTSVNVFVCFGQE